MAMIATMLRRSLHRHWQNTCQAFRIDKPTNGATTNPAMTTPVPGVESQETSKSASSAFGAGVTGGMRYTKWCSPGTGCFQETVSRTLTTGFNPHNTTDAVRRMKGDHARRIRPAPSGSEDSLMGGSPG